MDTLRLRTIRGTNLFLCTTIITSLGALHARLFTCHPLRGQLMNFFRRFPLIGGATALFAACPALSGPGNGLEVNVSGAAFERIGTPAIASVPFSVVNRGSASEFVARCGSRVMAALDRWNGQSWIQYSGDACIAIYTTAPLEVAPGASVAASRSVPDAGRYRLRLGAADAATGGFDWSIVSRDFEVR